MPKLSLASLRLRRALRRGAAAIVIVAPVTIAAPAWAQEVRQYNQEVRQYNIAPQDLNSALREFANQTGRDVLYPPALVSGRRSPGAQGRLTERAALDALLSGTGLRFEQTRSNGYVVVPVSGEAEAAGAAADSGSAEAGQAGVAEILVIGTRSQNVDIRRTEDDSQPYVIFSREDIERSTSNDVQGFLVNNLTSIATVASPNQSFGNAGSNFSAFRLRALSGTQTLVLVDGRRIAPISFFGEAIQGDLNGIPLSAIERIEVLPTTASAIYGGSATGGVINVILRRDYRGVEAALTYSDSFRGGGASRRIDVTAGFSLENGRTSVLLTGSYSDASKLLVADRDFTSRGRAAILANNPNALLRASQPRLGATTNICSAASAFSCSTTPLTLRNGTPVGSAITFIPFGYTGVTSDGGNALVANGGRYNLALANTAQISGGNRLSLLNAPTIKVAGITIRRDFNNWLSGFVDLAASENVGRFSSTAFPGTFFLPATAPSNPFSQAVLVTTPIFGTDAELRTRFSSLKAVGGAIIQLPRQWRASIDYSWNRTTVTNQQFASTLNTLATDAVQAGTINIFRDTNINSPDFANFAGVPSMLSPAKTTLQSISARLGGALWWLSLPGGKPGLTVALEHRTENLGEFVIESRSGANVFRNTFPPRSQNVDSIYAELVAPILAPSNEIPGLHMLELTVAGRADHYVMRSANRFTAGPGIPDPVITRVVDRFSSVNPTIGLRYQPLPDLMLRASYATGFQPPALSQLVPSAPRTTTLVGFTDPRRGNETIGTITLLSGGNPDLNPETSESRSAGIILTPRFLQGLRVSVDWTEIRREQVVADLAISQDNINNEDLYPGFITRAAPSDGFSAGRITTISIQSLNFAKQRVEALDFSADYRFVLGSIGDFAVGLAGTHNIHFINQTVLTSPPREGVGMQGTNRLNATLSIDWQRGPWEARFHSRYFGPYYLLSSRLPLPNQGAAKVPSQIYHDLTVAYTFPAGQSLLSGTRIQFGVRNMFNRRPPLDLNNSFFFYSANGDPRMASYYFSIRRAF